MVDSILRWIIIFLFKYFGKRHKYWQKTINFARKSYWINAKVNGIENAKVFGRFQVLRPENLFLEKGVTINESVLIVARDKIYVGKNTRISPGVKIISGGLNYKEKQAEEPRVHISKEIKIGDNVWLATGCLILPGVSIGDNCVIAAGAVVTKDIPKNSIAFGIPAKFRPLK